jgi:hypothetical protein
MVWSQHFLIPSRLQYPSTKTSISTESSTKTFTSIETSTSKQRWYCVCCGIRFKIKFGMLVEIHITSPAHASIFMLAEISNRHVDEVRAMYLEHTLKPTDHKDLWQKIPDFKPMAPGDIMRPCKESEFYIHDGFDKALIYKLINPAGLNGLPKWSWDSIFTFVDLPT